MVLRNPQRVGVVGRQWVDAFVPMEHLRLLTGADLDHARIGQADLRGAVLRNADLTKARLISAFVGCNLQGADLTGALFLTQAQLDAARVS